MSTPTRIAVTGAAGLIGTAVAKRLAQDGHELVLLDQRPITVDVPATRVQCDLRDVGKVSDALTSVEIVCHLGEIPTVHHAPTPQEVFDTNTAICRTMLGAAVARLARRFIYTSSCQQYGFWGTPEYSRQAVPSVWPIDETLPASPQNKYAESKVANEAQCRAASEQHGLEVYIFRFPWVMGDLPPERAKGMWRNADEAPQEGAWTYLDVRDAAEAYALAVRPDRPLERMPSNCEAFHFVADEIRGSIPMSEKLRKYLPEWPPLPQNWPPHRPPVVCDKAARYLGWRPTRRLSERLSSL